MLMGGASLWSTRYVRTPCSSVTTGKAARCTAHARRSTRSSSASTCKASGSGKPIRQGSSSRRRPTSETSPGSSTLAASLPWKLQRAAGGGKDSGTSSVADLPPRTIPEEDEISAPEELSSEDAGAGQSSGLARGPALSERCAGRERWRDTAGGEGRRQVADDATPEPISGLECGPAGLCLLRGPELFDVRLEANLDVQLWKDTAEFQLAWLSSLSASEVHAWSASRALVAGSSRDACTSSRASFAPSRCVLLEGRGWCCRARVALNSKRISIQPVTSARNARAAGSALLTIRPKRPSNRVGVLVHSPLQAALRTAIASRSMFTNTNLTSIITLCGRRFLCAQAANSSNPTRTDMAAPTSMVLQGTE
mmetsp:Transcript_24559/g.46589  ORF Transcript_24559/g.46589 Transcript_24559/m.46589 type:complete len:367 (-) Transcript_24559:498-1598(-)